MSKFNPFADPVKFIVSLVIVYAVWWYIQSKSEIAATAYVTIILLSVYMYNRVAINADLKKAGVL